MADQESERPYTVVVGVSATSKSRAALAWAQSQAKQCGGQLIAVRAWRMPYPQTLPSGSADVDLPQPNEVEAHALKTLEADVAEVLGEDHGAEIRLVRGGKLKTLVKAAVGADLLVVDAPQQLIAGPAFAHRLIYAASCPVVAMPPALTNEGPSALARVVKSVGLGLEAVGGSADHPAYRPPVHN
ncbi:MAG: universal stress protein [Microlunatus sp.]